MKHVKLFEQFILEASSSKRIKEIQAELQEIEKEMEEVQDAMDSGDWDKDEAELRLNDLDGNKLDLESELEDLKKGDQEAAQRKITPIVSKTIEAISLLGSQSVKWSTKLQYASKEEKSQLEYLIKRDQDEEKQDQVKADKMIAKCDALMDKMSPDMLALYSFAKEDWRSISMEFTKAGMALQGIKEACEDYENGCNAVKDYKKTYDTVFPNYQKTQAQLRELAKKVNVRV